MDPTTELGKTVPTGSGIRINKLYGKAKLEEVMAVEMEERMGKVLVTGMNF